MLAAQKSRCELHDNLRGLPCGKLAEFKRNGMKMAFRFALKFPDVHMHCKPPTTAM